MLNYTYEDVADHREGDIIKIQGKSYFLETKRSRTIKIRRYYWTDRIAAKVMKILGGK